MFPIDNLQERLTAMNDPFRAADDGTPPEDGDYQGLVQSFDFFEGRGQIFLKTVLVIQHDEKYQGREVECVHNLEDPARLDFAKKHLATLGLDTSAPGFDLGNLETQLHELLDVPVDLTIKRSDKTKDDGTPYVNVYVNRRLGPPLRAQTDVQAPQASLDVGGQAPGSAVIGADQDIPF